MWLSRDTFERHAKNDEVQFGTIVASLKAHDANVDAKHQENRAQMLVMQSSLDDIIKLRPAIEAGLLADKDAEYRKKLFRRVGVAVVTTAAAMGGLFPMMQWISTMRIHFGTP